MDAQWTISDDLFFTALSAMFSQEKVPAVECLQVVFDSLYLTLSAVVCVVTKRCADQDL